VTHLYPANAGALAEFAEETGAEVLRGALRYPSESGGWQLASERRHNMDLVRLKPSEKRLAAKVYARSFFDYPMVTHYWPDPDRRARYLEWYLGCAINYGLAHGEVYTTPDIAGIAVWLPPGQTHISMWRYIRAGFLALPFAMGIVQFFTVTMPSDNLVERVHEEIAQGPHWYLWGLAVDPDRQGEGIGSMLMRPGLESAGAQHLPCYLETHSERNGAFYTKFGFNLVRTVQVPGSDLCFWCFLREPQGRPPSVPT
jgi:ribosomal protein S18 acetylase RimI-like enzyme